MLFSPQHLPEVGVVKPIDWWQFAAGRLFPEVFWRQETPRGR